MSGRASALLIVLIFALDQVTKQMIVAGFQLGESLTVIPGFFSITYLRNRGGAFGLLAELPDAWRVTFFVVFAVATVAALVQVLRGTARADLVMRLAITSVIGGAIGNLWDRIRYGEVVDFLDVFVRNWHWPAFNVADSFISCGVVLIVLGSMRPARHEGEALEHE